MPHWSFSSTCKNVLMVYIDMDSLGLILNFCNENLQCMKCPFFPSQTPDYFDQVPAGLVHCQCQLDFAVMTRL